MRYERRPSPSPWPKGKEARNLEKRVPVFQFLLTARKPQHSEIRNPLPKDVCVHERDIFFTHRRMADGSHEGEPKWKRVIFTFAHKVIGELPSSLF